MAEDKLFKKPEKSSKPAKVKTDNNRPLDEQTDVEYVCVGKNELGLRQFAVKKKGQ